MKLFAAAVLLFCVTANAYHVSKQRLLGPMFLAGQTHVYDVTMDLVSSISGLSAQHSRFVMNAEAAIYAKSSKDHVLKLMNVRVSEALSSVPSYTVLQTLQTSKDLEEYLSIPIKFTMEKKQVTSYTLDARETLESKKIKKSILRMLGLYVDEEKIHTGAYGQLPITYNLTRNNPLGDYQSHYMITSSPYEEFPLKTNVLNISRSDNYENIPYPAYIFQHNFMKQGCPEVCKNNWEGNKFGAGCPSGFEPHQSPVKIYYNHHHHLVEKNDVYVPEAIDVDEYHIFKSYDQKMEIFIRFYMLEKRTTEEPISEPSGQQSYTDLDDYEVEINEKEINEVCIYPIKRKAIEASNVLLDELADIVVTGNLESKESTLVGEKLILLQKSLGMLQKSDLESVASHIGLLRNRDSPDKEKVKRQIWFNMLGTIGTTSSVSFITDFILKNIERDLTVWEVKEILEALPENIHNPNQNTVRELMKVCKMIDNTMWRAHLLHSAAYITVGKVVNKVCSKHYSMSLEESSTMEPDDLDSRPGRIWATDYKRVFSNLRLTRTLESSESLTCPTSFINDIIETVVQKLKISNKKQQKAIYIQTLAQINTLETLKHLAEYSFGIAEDMQQFTPSQVDFFRVLTLYALHNSVRKYPQEVLKIVAPIYFNRTEEPKVRNAAFSVILRAQPSRELLEHIVHDTWQETSLEVGSYVTSSLETFGNSSLPCDQLTAQRIKMVISQAKRVNIGFQHSKNLFYSFTDDLRSYGHEERFEYTANGESIVPSTIYHAFTYLSKNMKDVVSQTAINVQGVTSKMIFDKINEIIGFRTGKPLSPKRESEIFGQMNHEGKIPEDFKMTFFNRLFYASSYYYIEDLVDFAPAATHFYNYFQSGRNYKGTYVKILMPSTLHTVAVAKTVPFPVEMEQKFPILLAVQMKNHATEQTDLKKMHLSMTFSLYASRILSSYIKNLRDCNEVGSYYEHKLSMNVPYEISFDLNTWNKLRAEYSFKSLPKKIITVKTEAGTFVGKKTLYALPQMSGRSAIKRVPEQFKREHNLDVVGLPPIHITTHTENMAEGYGSIPRTVTDVLNWITTNAMNAGWRSRSVNVTMNTNATFWPENTKVSLEIDYNRQRHQPQSMTESRRSSSGETDDEDEIVNDLDVDDDVHSRKASDWMSRGRKVHNKIISSLPHMQHVLDIQVRTTPVSNKAYVKAEYNHTLGRHMQIFRMDAAVNLKRLPVPFHICADHIVTFNKRPNEFKFDKSSFSQQRGRFLSSFSLHQTKPFENVDLLFGGSMKRMPMSEILNDMLVSHLDEKHFLPGDYEKCERDTKIGRSLSKECVQSIREMSNFNTYNMFALWKEGDLPSIYRTLAKKVESWTRSFALGHVQYTEAKNPKNTVGLNVTYIDKMTDIPLIDITLEKPSEVVKYNKMPAGVIKPLSSIHTIFDTYVQATTNNTYPATCNVMEKYLSTYDVKTYQLPSDGCQYLISAPCTQHKLFAVVGKTLSHREGTKEIKLYIGDHEIILMPKTILGYKVKVNGHDNTIHISRPVFLKDEDTDLSVSLNTGIGGTFLDVYESILGLKLTYNGNNVKVQVSPIFKGELCGLCSTFDGETVKEYLAPDMCLYSNAEDFIKRSVIDPEECHANVDLSVPRICHSDTHRQTQSTGSIIRRNVVKHQKDTVCFSTEPVPVCRHNRQPIESDETSVGFYCLPKNDITTQKLISDASTKELDVMRAKDPEFVEHVTIAKQC